MQFLPLFFFLKPLIEIYARFDQFSFINVGFQLKVFLCCQPFTSGYQRPVGHSFRGKQLLFFLQSQIVHA